MSHGGVNTRGYARATAGQARSRRRRQILTNQSGRGGSGGRRDDGGARGRVAAVNPHQVGNRDSFFGRGTVAGIRALGRRWLEGKSKNNSDQLIFFSY